jgi:hypothetical protein
LRLLYAASLRSVLREEDLVDTREWGRTIVALTTEYSFSYLEWLRVGPCDATATADGRFVLPRQVLIPARLARLAHNGER